jgi:hypothetical protein
MLQQLFRPKSSETGIVTGVYANNGLAEKSQQSCGGCFLVSVGLLKATYYLWGGTDPTVEIFLPKRYGE